MRARTTIRAAAVVVLGAAAASTSAGPTLVLEEYFNNYGTVNANLNGQGAAGAGWSGAWAGSTMHQYGSLTVSTANHLTFNDPDYRNDYNQGEGNDGVARTGTPAVSSMAYRSFATPMDGTVWISALARYSAATADDVLLWLDSGGTFNNNFLGLRNNQGHLRYGTTGGTIANPTTAAGLFSANTTYLLVLKVEMNKVGANDAVSAWIFDTNPLTAGIPSLPASESLLPAPMLSVAATNDVYGATFNDIGVSFNTSGMLDAIRVTNYANGFRLVTAIPEPTSLAAMGVLALAWRRPGRRA